MPIATSATPKNANTHTNRRLPEKRLLTKFELAVIRVILRVFVVIVRILFALCLVVGGRVVEY